MSDDWWREKAYEVVRFIMWCTSWALFWIGDIVSIIMNYGILGKLYPVYNWLMYKSFNLSDAYDLDVWDKK